MTDDQLLELAKNPHYVMNAKQLRRLAELQNQPHDLSFGSHELGFNKHEQIPKIEGRRDYGGDRKPNDK